MAKPCFFLWWEKRDGSSFDKSQNLKEGRIFQEILGKDDNYESPLLSIDFEILKKRSKTRENRGGLSLAFSCLLK